MFPEGRKDPRGARERAEKRVYPERKGGFREAWDEVSILRPAKLCEARIIGEGRCAVGVREEKEDSLCAALREGVAPMLFMRMRRKVTSVSCQSERFGVKG